MLASREGLIPITCGSNVLQEHFANPHQRAAHCTRCHAPSHCRPNTCTTLRKEKPKEMLNVSERSLVNVYCWGERVKRFSVEKKSTIFYATLNIYLWTENCLFRALVAAEFLSFSHGFSPEVVRNSLGPAPVKGKMVDEGSDQAEKVLISPYSFRPSPFP